MLSYHFTDRKLLHIKEYSFGLLFEMVVSSVVEMLLVSAAYRWTSHIYNKIKQLRMGDSGLICLSLVIISGYTFYCIIVSVSSFRKNTDDIPELYHLILNPMI